MAEKSAARPPFRGRVRFRDVAAAAGLVAALAYIVTMALFVWASAELPMPKAEEGIVLVIFAGAVFLAAVVLRGLTDVSYLSTTLGAFVITVAGVVYIWRNPRPPAFKAADLSRFLALAPTIVIAPAAAVPAYLVVRRRRSSDAA